jgi:hypothetical protein
MCPALREQREAACKGERTLLEEEKSMIHTPDMKPKFFSLTHSVYIDGARYLPTVCYKLSESLYETVKGLEAKGLARTYTEEVRFVTGVAYPVKKPEAPKSKDRPVAGGRLNAKKRRLAKAAAQTKLE